MKKTKIIFFIAILFTLVSISAVCAADNLNNTDMKTLETNANEILTTDEHASGEGYIDFEKDNTPIEKGKENKNITGTLYYSEGEYVWSDVNLNCNYTDGNGIERSYSAKIKDAELNFDLRQCEGLIVSNTPYKLTFSPVNDSYYDYFLSYNNNKKIADSYILLTVTESQGPVHSPEIYVGNNGNDTEGYGNQDNPYKTISYAISKAQNNDIIYIYSGVYDLNPITLTNNLTFIGLSNEVNITSSTTAQGKKLFTDSNTASKNSYKFINLTFTSVKFGSNSLLFELKNTGENTFENCKFNGLSLKTIIDSYGPTTISNCQFNGNSPNAMSTGSLITLRAKSTIKNTNIIKSTNTLSSGYVKLIYITKNETTLDNVNITETNGKFILFDVAKDTITNIKNSKIINNKIKAQSTTAGLMFNIGTVKNSIINVTNTVIANNTIERGLTYGSYAESTFNLNYNIIYNNTGKLIAKVGPTYNFNYNYWGNNSNPDSGNITSWIIVETSHTPNSVFDNEEFTVIATLKVTDNEGNIADLKNPIPEVPVTFEYDNQKISKIITGKSTEERFTFNKTSEDILVTVINEKLTDQITEKEYTIYVAPTGTDADGFGSKNKPYKTIKYAVSKADHNYTIYVYEGKYDENSIVLTNNITIIGENKNVIITSSIDNKKVFESLYNENGNNISIRFENLTFDTIKPGQYNAILNLRNEGKTEIINCVFENTDGERNIWSSSTETTIENCEFKNICFTSSGSLIYLTGKGTPKIINTTFNKITSTANGVVTLINIINKPTNATIDNMSVREVSGKFYVVNMNNNGYGDINNSVSIKNSKFENNEIEKTNNNQGGILFLAEGSSKIEITNSTIIENIAARGIFAGTSAETNIIANNNLIYNNTANILYSTKNPVESYNMEYNYWGSDNPDLGDLNIHIISINKEFSEMKSINNPVDPTMNVTLNNTIGQGENLTIEVTLNEDATGTITITGIDSVKPQTLKDGKTTFIIENLKKGQYPITITYNGSSDYKAKKYETTIIVKINKIVIPGGEDALNMTTPKDSETPSFSINIAGITGNLTVTVDGKDNYTSQIDANGSATVNVAKLTPGKHNITITYSGDDHYFEISKNITVDVAEKITPPAPVHPVKNKVTTTIIAKNIKIKAKVKTKKYSITLKANGKAVGNVQVIIKIKGKTYKAKTNAKGKATFKIKKLTKKGKYNSIIKFAGNSKFNPSSKTVKITIK